MNLCVCMFGCLFGEVFPCCMLVCMCECVNECDVARVASCVYVRVVNGRECVPVRLSTSLKRFETHVLFEGVFEIRF